MIRDLCYYPRNISREEVEESLPVIREVMSKHDITFSYILGSILIKEARPRDLDIAVYLASPTQSIQEYYDGVYNEAM